MSKVFCLHSCLHKKSAVHRNAKTIEKHLYLLHWAGAGHLSQTLYVISTKQISTVFEWSFTKQGWTAHCAGSLFGHADGVQITPVYLLAFSKIIPHHNQTKTAILNCSSSKTDFWQLKTLRSCGRRDKMKTKKKKGFSNLLTLGHGHGPQPVSGPACKRPPKDPFADPGITGPAQLGFYGVKSPTVKIGQIQTATRTIKSDCCSMA